MVKHTPILLTRHEQDLETYRALCPEEVRKVVGGYGLDCETAVVTPNQDGSDISIDDA